MKRIIPAFLIFLFIAAPALASKNPLAPLKTDNPRDTMRSFMEAMNDYRKGDAIGSSRLKVRIDDAVRCLNLDDVSVMSRQQTGIETAIMLKEVIDRIIVIDYEKIPEAAEKPDEPLERWRLKNTEIVIARVRSGDRTGEYLFSPDTVARAEEFFEKVKHLPYLEDSGYGAGYKEPWLQRNMPDWATKDLFSLAYWQWIGLFLALLVGLAMRSAARWLGRLIGRLTSRTSTAWDDRLAEALAGPAGLLAATGIWFGALHLFRISGMAMTILSVVVEVLLFAALTWLVYRLAGVLAEYVRTITARTEDQIDDQLVNLVDRSLKVFIVIFGALLGAQNLGIDVFSLLAGLGIGGLAVALAAKDSLSNFFGSITIMLDRPFQVGDWVVVGGAEGTVEDIGFRSTKIRTFYNSIISVPNSEIAMANVDNMGRREYRRALAKLGITYDTPAEKIEAFLEGVKNIIKANSYTRKDYFHVVFNAFGESGLEIMLYFFLKVPDWSAELIERQNIFLEITRLADKLGVNFAFPTQTVHIDTFQDKSAVGGPGETDKEKLLEIAGRFSEGGSESRPGGSGIFTPPYKEQS